MKCYVVRSSAKDNYSVSVLEDQEMKRVLVKSVFDAFEYVMSHYYPYGQEEYAERLDTYAVISIQDTHTGGFGFCFRENQFCKGVLTLYFDDIVKEVPGAVLFSDEQAEQILDFVSEHRDVDTLLVHCYGGQSRSRAVGAFVVRMFGRNPSGYFQNGNQNQYVYDVLEAVWIRRMISGKANMAEENK